MLKKSAYCAAWLLRPRPVRLPPDARRRIVPGAAPIPPTGNDQPRNAKALTKLTPTATPPPATPNAAIADPRLDELILQAAQSEWCKVAMLIARVTDAARAASINAATQTIATRIYAMTADNRLEVQGNVRRWRASKVRKTPAKV